MGVCVSYGSGPPGGPSWTETVPKYRTSSSSAETGAVILPDMSYGPRTTKEPDPASGDKGNEKESGDKGTDTYEDVHKNKRPGSVNAPKFPTATHIS